jgi:glycosyltransferase involved in cell wall biosynthesis
MGFPPNYRAAQWFIERVMPLLLLRNKEIRLVIAGQEPVPELRAKAGPHVEVTGLVPDISVEIARSQLYVAPLRSGSGFRNKIVEALNSGTFVIGTPMALEFLDDRLRSKLLTASNAHEFADLILNFLENPQAFNQRLAEARQILRNEYLWPSRVQQLEALCAGLKNGLREVIV